MASDKLKRGAREVKPVCAAPDYTRKLYLIEKGIRSAWRQGATGINCEGVLPHWRMASVIARLAFEPGQTWPSSDAWFGVFMNGRQRGRI